MLTNSMQRSLRDDQVQSQQQSLNYLRNYPAFIETEVVSKFITAVNECMLDLKFSQL
jgi:hypothetical protein